MQQVKATPGDCGGRSMQSVLGEVPTADTDDHTADEFAAFFSDKFVHLPLRHRCTMFRTDTRRHSLNGVQ